MKDCAQKTSIILIALILSGCSSYSEKGDHSETSEPSSASVATITDNEEMSKESSSVIPDEGNDEENPAESKLPKTAEPAESESRANGRPEITHKYSAIILCADYPAISNYAENVVSVIDPEDGEIPYYNIGGIVGPYSEEDEYNFRHPKDNPEAVSNHGSPFYYSMGFNYLNGGEGSVPVVTVAYDSQGQVSYKEYEIIYVAGMPNESNSKVTVLVDGLRVRKTPSTSGEVVGNVWKGACYCVYETVNQDGYNWFRISHDMWIADNGDWLQLD